MNNSQSPILDFSRSDPNKGTLFDTRDGQSYQVVKIGNQIWLAENFRYLPSKEKGDLYENSCVYDNDNNYLDLYYGRLYDWNTANIIAPEGWKLPNNQDFIELKDFINKDNNLVENDFNVGSYLKSVNGWNKSTNIEPNTDKYGFNAKPAGFFNNESGKFYYSRGDASFWSTTEIYNSSRVGYWDMNYDCEDFSGGYDVNGNCRFSVRLIKI
jgi:uncharacterized protein (TIGR02145 family)